MKIRDVLCVSLGVLIGSAAPMLSQAQLPRQLVSPALDLYYTAGFSRIAGELERVQRRVAGCCERR